MKGETMKMYSVMATNSEVDPLVVEARNEWSAVKKAHEKRFGKRSRGKVTWHGTHAEIDGYRYMRPVQESR